VSNRWYRPRKYPHFDLPLTEAEAAQLVTNPKTVAQHSFWPFLAFDLERRRYKSKDGVGIVSVKKRPIRIASHRDGYILAYYASVLAECYEKRIAGTALQEAVLAYRRGLGSSIDFAMAAFNEIESRAECVVFAFDLEGFFDSIDHKILKDQWCRTLDVKRLPADSFAIYRAITAYATVNREECLKVLGVAVGATIPRPLCTPSAFHTKLRQAKLVHTNDLPYGIPQGSPISAVLSNVYMVTFDVTLSTWANDNGGYYRRYCDDILLVVPPDKAAVVSSVIAVALKGQGDHLFLNDKKTTETHFKAGRIAAGPVLQYLGFTFDGSVRLIRSQTLSKFWRRVVYGVRAARRRAKKSSVSPHVYRRKLYRRFTHLGKSNFLTYAKRAWTISDDKGIRRQVRRHWERLHEELKNRR